MEHLQEKNKTLSVHIVELEQYSRKNCLLLHEVKESPNENTDELIIQTISHELGLELERKRSG